MVIRSKIKYLYILSLCLLKYLIRGRANKKIEGPSKFLVIQTAKLGDMVCTTPVFRAIKSKYPKSKVYVGGGAGNAELLKNSLDVDEYIVYGNNFWKVLRQIKKEKIEFGCVAVPDFLGLALLFLGGVRMITAPETRNDFSPNETRAYNILKRFAVTIPFFFGEYFPRQYLNLLSPIGIESENTKKRLGFSKKANERISEFLREKDISSRFLTVGISPSAGNKIKLWSPENFAKLADYVCEKYKTHVIIIGGKNDRKEVEDMIKFSRHEAINTLNLFDIDELKALISKMDIFISVDTGPIYIAEAFNVPTIDIVGPMDEREQPPQGEFNRVVVAQRKEPQLHIMNARNYNFQEARRQVEDISVGAVIMEFDNLFLKIKGQGRLQKF